MQFEILSKKLSSVCLEMTTIETKGYKNMSFCKETKDRVKVVLPSISDEEEGRLLLLSALVSYNDIASASGMPLREQFNDALRCIMAIYGHDPDTMEEIREDLVKGISSLSIK